MLQQVRHNRPFFITFILSIVLVLAMGVVLIVQQVNTHELEATHTELSDQLNRTEMTTAEQQAAVDKEKKESIQKTTGLDPSLVTSDTDEATSYFEPAFNWSSGEEYDHVREQYIDSLGDGNTFTSTYLPADTKIATNDGDLSYIDFEGLQATMQDLHVVPIHTEGNRIRYVAFVQYIMHQDDSDLANPEALETSEAIIEFTVAGEKGDRQISEVSARTGFQAIDE